MLGISTHELSQEYNQVTFLFGNMIYYFKIWIKSTVLFIESKILICFTFRSTQ